MNILWFAVAAALLMPAAAMAQQDNDLREFRVGMPVSALPSSGYTGFACAFDPTKRLAGWSDFDKCPAQPDGSRAVSFRYGSTDDDGSAKTQVGGHPVNLALLISSDAQVSGMRIETDPNARLYVHKKAYLFGLQVRSRFGDDGWACRSAAPTPTEQPVGGVFINEHCEKATASRHFILDRQLFRDPAKDLREFTDATQLTILRAG